MQIEKTVISVVLPDILQRSVESGNIHRVTEILKPPQTNVNQIDTTVEKSDDEESVNYITSYQQLYDQVYDSNYDSDSDDYVASISYDSENQLETLNAQINFGSVQAKARIDSRSVVSLFTKTLANRILKTSPSAKWTTTKQEKYLKFFSNEPIKVLGKFTTTVKYYDWTCKEASLTVVEDGHKIIIFNRLGIAVVQPQARSSKCVNSIDNSKFKIKGRISSQFPYLVSRIGLSSFIKNLLQSIKKVDAFRLIYNLELQLNYID